MRCASCTKKIEKKYGIVATVLKISRGSITVELTTPEDRLSSIDGKKPFVFPFFLRRGGMELQFCTTQCASEYLKHETIQE